jgi:hypothetical protein
MAFNFQNLVLDGITEVTPLIDASRPGPVDVAVLTGYDLATKK